MRKQNMLLTLLQLLRIVRASQEFGRKKDENRSEFEGSILVIFCCKEFEKSRCADILANQDRGNCLF